MSWFDEVFTEYNQRGEAMFVFSRKQIEEQGVTWADFQSAQWSAIGAGLYVKRSVRAEFVARLEAAQQVDAATRPEVRVRYIGTDDWDRPVYRTEGGRRLADVALNLPNRAIELHTLTRDEEPIAALPARLVFVTAAAATAQPGSQQ